MPCRSDLCMQLLFRESIQALHVAAPRMLFRQRVNEVDFAFKVQGQKEPTRQFLYVLAANRLQQAALCDAGIQRARRVDASFEIRSSPVVDRRQGPLSGWS